jgi:hypothetical protein
VRAEIVLIPNDLARRREVTIRKIPKDGRVISGGVPIGCAFRPS